MSRNHSLPVLSLVIALAGVSAATFRATAAVEAQPRIESPSFTTVDIPMGQPPEYRFEWGTLGGYGFQSDRPTFRFLTDIEGRVALPQVGLLDLAIEGTYGRTERESKGTIGASLKLPVIRCGFEYDLHDRNPYFKVALQGAPRRGGILGRGDRVRIDYTPSLRRLEAGIKMPFPWMRYRPTRPRNAAVAMPRGKLPHPVAITPERWPAAEVAKVRHAMEWVDRLMTPNLTPRNPMTDKGRRALKESAAALNNHVRMPGHSFAAEDSTYHANLRAAFTVAAGGDEDLGEALASEARRVLLRRVIIPNNRLLGRIKRPGELTGLLEEAHVEFTASLDRNELRVGTPQRDAVLEVYRQVLDQLGAVARAAKHRWRTWRLVWLPLNFALRPEEYDSQPELNSVIGEVMGRSFTSANDVRYVLNEQFYLELRRSILETRDYHVVWIHDYSGRNGLKAPDRISWSLAIDGYIESFVRAVRAMDQGEREDLPSFLLLLDEHYFRANGSQKVVSFLEHLGTADAPHFSDQDLDARVRASLARLRDVVEASESLKRRGARYLESRLKVHVVITHPFDPTYLDDMVMRDHTKLAFRDVYEDDPASGEAIFTGLGVGEHYVGPQWEDRSLVLRGSEAVQVKTAARELLITQGVRADEMPTFLRARPYPKSYDRTCDSLRSAGWTANVLTVMNGTGFRPKEATVLKATIYNLMRRGAVLIAPDSLWTSDFWAGMFLSAALRGCHAFPIAPARENAPSSALPTLGLMHQTVWALARSAELLHDAILDAGGTLRVGLYTDDRDVDDVGTLLHRLLEKGCRDTPLRDRVAIPPSVIQALRDEDERLCRDYPGPLHILPIGKPRRPQLHLKMQFFASEAALPSLRGGDWASTLVRYLGIRRRQSLGTSEGTEAINLAMMLSDGPPVRSAVPEPVGADSMGRDRSVERGAAFYLSTIGSHNQDRRSLLLDGEVLTVVAGDECLPALIDLGLLMGIVAWPDRADDLHAYFPKTGGLLRRLSRFLRDLI